MVGQGFGVNAERRKVKGVQIKSFQGTNAGEGGVGLAVHVALAQIDPRTVDGGPLYQSSKGKNVYKKKKRQQNSRLTNGTRYTKSYLAFMNRAAPSQQKRVLDVAPFAVGTFPLAFWYFHLRLVGELDRWSIGRGMELGDDAHRTVEFS